MINHLWIIMDWNRRWAKSRLLPSFMWHKAWYDTLVKTCYLAKNYWINYLTVWALSTDNLNKRDDLEVKKIIELINWIDKMIPKLLDLWASLKVIWDISKLPEKTQSMLQKVIDKTKKWEFVLTIWLIYWWQYEIVRATKRIINSWIDPEKLSREEFRKYLDSSFLPTPDIIIRTWWDIRHSWFLLYDSEYSEYYFTDKYWPDFDENELKKVISEFENSKRNFWK